MYKKENYPELVRSDVVKLTTLACEVGGRWREECAEVLAKLAVARARAVPRHLQLAARLSYERRWWALLSCAQQDALASTLVDDAVYILDGHDGWGPTAVDVALDRAPCGTAL